MYLDFLFLRWSSSAFLGTLTVFRHLLYKLIITTLLQHSMFQLWNAWTFCQLGNFVCFLWSADFFQNQLFRNSFRNTIGVSSRLDPDQARHTVGSNLVPNCLQKLLGYQQTTLVGNELTSKLISSRYIANLSIGESSNFFKSWTVETHILKIEVCLLYIHSFKFKLSLDRLKINQRRYNLPYSGFWGWLSVES